MLTDLIITDLTNMHADRICVAGVNDRGQSIRPLYRNKHLFKDWCYQSEKTVQPFSKIQVDLIEHAPKPPHTEDWIMANDHFIHYGVLSKHDKHKVLKSTCTPSVEKIFMCPINHVAGEGTFVKSGQGHRSLGTIKPRDIGDFSHTEFDGHWDYRVCFEDLSGDCYKLKIVDLTFQDYVDKLRYQQYSTLDISNKMNEVFKTREIFLRIGLSRNWGKYPDRCYLQVTGVYTIQQ